MRFKSAGFGIESYDRVADQPGVPNRLIGADRQPKRRRTSRNGIVHNLSRARVQLQDAVACFSRCPDNSIQETESGDASPASVRDRPAKLWNWITIKRPALRIILQYAGVRSVIHEPDLVP